MTTTDPIKPGLRQRKKTRTRAEIRLRALRLFAEQGYAATTIEQIAAAAEVSPSTFFRYFPTKERLVLADDLETVMLTTLAEQPAELPLLAAFRRAVVAGLIRTDREEEEQRRQLIATVPELRQAQLDELARIVTVLARALIERANPVPDDFEALVFVGALTGALLAVLRDSSSDVDSISRALGYLESGFRMAS